jgi:hypothetical protein
MRHPLGSVALLFRGDREMRAAADATNTRLAPIFTALGEVGVAAEPCVFAEDMVDEVRAQLLLLDGVLVWVDPISGEADRALLDELLREVAGRGILVSAHPDVVRKMGTKRVLYDTKHLGWGTDTHLYRSHNELVEQFPGRLASGPRVLKQHRGNGGIGTWKATLVASGGEPAVRVQHAHMRDTVTEDLSLRDFLDRCRAYFTPTGLMIDQPFVPRITEGLIRCYLVCGEVVGFARQYATGLGEDPARIMGLPSAKTMLPRTEPGLASLRERVESDWVPAMQEIVGVEAASLPVLWDADFLYGPKDEAGEDTYVLCEINVSAVYPFPEQAPGKLAQAVAARLRHRRGV